jgi:UDPglucose 6-dehydrogenase
MGPAAIAGLLATPVLADLRNIFSPDAAAAAGLTYHSIGRAPKR